MSAEKRGCDSEELDFMKDGAAHAVARLFARMRNLKHRRFVSNCNCTRVFSASTESITRSDFAKLATILPRHHIHFAALDDNKLRETLAAQRLPHKTKTAILKSVAESRKSLWSTLRLLRRRWHFVNVRRLLSPLPEMNAVVLAALNEWATQWQKHSSSRSLDETAGTANAVAI